MTIPLILSVISLCVCVLSFFFFRWYIGRKTAARELLADYRAEVYRLIAEIDAASDRDSLLVEERIKMLKKIIEDTDRRIGVYMRELQRSRGAEAMYNNLGRGIRAALDSRPPQLDQLDQFDQLGQLGPHPKDAVSQGALFPEEARSQQKTPSQAEEIPLPQETRLQKETASPPPLAPAQKSSSRKRMPAAGKRKPPKNKLKAQIAELSAKGLSPQQIASRLHLSLAEIDLALNLLQPMNN